MLKNGLVDNEKVSNLFLIITAVSSVLQPLQALLHQDRLCKAAAKKMREKGKIPTNPLEQKSLLYKANGLKP
jgi:hypothetical protein